jgi:hypothetical protein
MVEVLLVPCLGEFIAVIDQTFSAEDVKFASNQQILRFIILFFSE